MEQLLHIIAILFCILFEIASGGKGPPRLTQRIDNRIIAQLGGTLRLLCPVESDPPPMIMWTKGRENIHQGWSRFKTLQNALRIKEIAEDDAGLYNCRATNGFGSINVNYTVIVVPDTNDIGKDGLDLSNLGPQEGNLYPDDHGNARPIGTKPIFTPDSTTKRRIILRPVGSTVRLRCAATGMPKPEIMWYKDGEILRDEDLGESKRGRWSLHLHDLQKEDSGVYMCKVLNAIGTINASFTVDVVDRVRNKPVLTGSHPLNTTVEYGGTASFQCKVRSDVPPHIQWLKRIEDTSQLKDINTTIDVGGQRFIVLKSGDIWSRPDGSYLNKLIISKAKDDDSGMYICLGANTMGYSFRSAFLTVLPNPNKRSFDVLEGSHNLGGGIPLHVVIAVPVAVIVIALATVVYFNRRKKCASNAANVRSNPQQDRLTPQEKEREQQWISLHQQHMQASRERIYKQYYGDMPMMEPGLRHYADIPMDSMTSLPQIHQHHHMHYEYQ